MQNFKLLSLVGSLVVSMVAQAEECSTISNKDVSQEDQVILIKVKGSYCVTEDIKVSEISKFDIHAGSFKRRISTVIATQVPNVSLDLKQHTLISKSANARGAQGIAIGESDTLLKNGQLKSIGSKAQGVKHNPSGYPYIKIFDKNNKSSACDMYSASCEDRSYLEGPDKLPPKYQDANITIDNMNIFATYRGVVLADNHNSIRNSTIEVDDNTAIYLMGQYPVIENNTIIIHSNKNNDTETQKKYNVQIKDGAIKLRDAQGGIIRNNRIIYKGGLFGGKAPVAINLLDSKDVLIEGNTVEGFDKLVRENGDTSFAENNNTFK